MRKSTGKRLEEAGWKVGSAQELLDLTDEDVALIEIKLALAASFRQRRQARGLTQAQVAGQLGSSQSRVAKMEAGDASVSLDLLVRGLLALGLTRQDVARIIARRAA